MTNNRLREDHYIAQTYLRRFSNEKGKIWVYDKEHLGTKERSTKSVCKEYGGSNNPYFSNERAIEEYLQIFENRWSKAVDVFSSEEPLDIEIYRQAKYVIAGYLAYLRFSTPAATGAGQYSLESRVKAVMAILMNKGDLPPPPDGLENKLRVEVDPKFHQALGASAMHGVSETLYNSSWMRLYNKSSEPFVTSDNPACIWYPKPESPGIHYLPLSPTVAILIKPRQIKSGELFDHSTDMESEAKPHFIPEINEHMTKCASNIVISSIRSESTKDMVSKFRDWSYRCTTQEIQMDKKVLIIDRWEAVKVEKSFKA